jgi:hypothetical protein
MSQIIGLMKTQYRQAILISNPPGAGVTAAF